MSSSHWLLWVGYVLLPLITVSGYVLLLLWVGMSSSHWLLWVLAVVIGSSVGSFPSHYSPSVARSGFLHTWLWGGGCYAIMAAGLQLCVKEIPAYAYWLLRALSSPPTFLHHYTLPHTLLPFYHPSHHHTHSTHLRRSKQYSSIRLRKKKNRYSASIIDKSRPWR